MSRLQELKQVLNQIMLAWERDKQAALVMLLDVKGSSYRLPGTKMMMATDGQMWGTISGGCLESDLFGWAEKAMETQTPLIHTYDLSENEIWSLGIGCKGNLEILILPIAREDLFWEKTRRLTQEKNTFSLVLEVPSGKRILVEENGTIHGDLEHVSSDVIEQAKRCLKTQTRATLYSYNGKRYVIDAVKPSEHLIVAGAGRDAVPVVELAVKVGFSVSVLDDRADLNNEKKFPNARHIVTKLKEVEISDYYDSCWIIMNHHQEKDEESLKLAIQSQPRFIGVLGPMSRTEEMLANIQCSFSSGPIRSPIGLDIGAETMEEVAVSIVSELMSVRAGSYPMPLHGKLKIHG